MRIIKLTAPALRAWKQNVPHLVDNSGLIIRPISVFEDTQITQAIRDTRAKRKGLERQATVTNETGKSVIHIVTTYTRRGNTDTDYTIDVSIDGHQYKSGREVLAAQLLAEFKTDIQIRHPNGSVLKTVRDPNQKRMTVKDSELIATHPDHCSCKEWGNPHPGTHYATCPQNRLAPPEHQAPKAPTEAELQTLPKVAYPSLARPDVTVAYPENPVQQAELLPSPQECKNGCLEWAVPAGKTLEEGQHHPVCFFHDKWRLKTVQEEQFWLVDLHTGEKVRRATRQEAGEAELAFRRTGASILSINDVPYGIVRDSDLASQLPAQSQKAAAV